MLHWSCSKFSRYFYTHVIHLVNNKTLILSIKHLVRPCLLPPHWKPTLNVSLFWKVLNHTYMNHIWLYSIFGPTLWVVNPLYTIPPAKIYSILYLYTLYLCCEKLPFYKLLKLYLFFGLGVEGGNFCMNLLSAHLVSFSILNCACCWT